MILLAEDHPDIREMIERRILAPAGYRVRSAGDGASALSLARELKPALLITDLHLPGLSGVDLIRRLHREMPCLPMILITSEGSEQIAVQAMRAGATDYMAKPFDGDQFLASVEHALAEGRRLRGLCEAQEGAVKLKGGLHNRLDELETLAVIGRTVTAMLDEDEVLKAVVESAVQLTGAEEGILLLLDEQSGELYIRASWNLEETEAQSLRLPINDSLAGQVIKSGEPILLDQSSPRKIQTAYLVHSLIYVPLLARGRAIGVLGVDNREYGRHFGQDEVRVMMAMADYAAIAIENANLYERSEAQRRWLEAILSHTENGVIVIDPQGKLLLINHAAGEALGISQDSIGSAVLEISDDPQILGLMSLSTALPLRDELELDDGRVLNIQRTAIEGVGQVIVMHDITHLKELDRIKSEFVTTVSHDLRSPLTAILGYVKLIERAGEVNQQQREFIRRVEHSVEQMTSLVSDLLDLGRIETDMDMTKEDAPMAIIARHAIESMRAAAETRGIALEVKLPEKMPVVRGNPVRLRQMMANLLDNAIKYTPSEGTVRIEAEAEEGQLILRVSDTGPGIPVGEQPYIFDKFFRGSAIPAGSLGTGLGLSIVKSIVDRHNGRIWVDSAPGKGTRFTVVLPTSSS